MMTANKHAIVASSSSEAPEPAANRQVVAEATLDDDYLCALHPHTMKDLSISDGDVVLLKSKRRCETRCVAVSDECVERKLKISKEVRSSLRVRLSDVVFVYACHDAKYVGGGRGRLRPVDEAAGALMKPFKEHRMFNCSFFVSLIIALYLFSF